MLQWRHIGLNGIFSSFSVIYFSSFGCDVCGLFWMFFFSCYYIVFLPNISSRFFWNRQDIYSSKLMRVIKIIKRLFIERCVSSAVIQNIQNSLSVQSKMRKRIKMLKCDSIPKKRFLGVFFSLLYFSIVIRSVSMMTISQRFCFEWKVNLFETWIKMQWSPWIHQIEKISAFASNEEEKKIKFKKKKTEIATLA